MAHIKRRIARLPYPVLLSKGVAVDAAMHNNPAYADISAKVHAHHDALAALKTAHTDYEACERELIRLKALRDDLRTEYVQAHGSLATATESETRDAQTLVGLGWDLRGSRSLHVGPLPAPLNLNATYGDHEGTCRLRWQAVPGMRFYKLECATSADGPWTIAYMDTSISCVVTGLTPGVQYWFRVCAHGGAGDSPWSDPATKRAA